MSRTSSRNIRSLLVLACSVVWSTPSPSGSPAAHKDELVAFFDDKPLNLLSPDGRYRLLSKTDRQGRVTLFAETVQQPGAGRREAIGRYNPPTTVVWSPKSDAFILNDQRGSGQTSYLEIVRLDHGRFRRDFAARRNASSLFARLFKCHLPADGIITTGTGWWDARTVTVSVQAQLHSGGCPLDPFASNELDLLVDARTGRVQERLLPRH
jgi:hypothetical protein